MAECGKEHIYTPAEKQGILEKLKYTHILYNTSPPHICNEELQGALLTGRQLCLGWGWTAQHPGHPSTLEGYLLVSPVSLLGPAPLIPPPRWLLGHLCIRTPSCHVRKFNCTAHRLWKITAFVRRRPQSIRNALRAEYISFKLCHGMLLFCSSRNLPLIYRGIITPRQGGKMVDNYQIPCHSTEISSIISISEMKKPKQRGFSNVTSQLNCEQSPLRPRRGKPAHPHYFWSLYPWNQEGEWRKEKWYPELFSHLPLLTAIDYPGKKRPGKENLRGIIK